MTSSDHLLLESLLDRWEQARRDRRPVTASELCVAHPTLLPELERRIAVMEWVLEHDCRESNDSTPDASLETALCPANSTPAATPAAVVCVGDEFDGLVLIRLIGRGGMGEVWEADEPRLRRRVAVKFLRAELSGDPTALRRFAREGLAHAAVQHDNVLAVFSVGRFRDRPYMVTPLLDGEPLSVRLKRERRLPTADVLRIGRELAAGLTATHSRGLIHRDVKPANVWLSRDGKVILLDFGLARSGQEFSDGEPLTRSGMVMGTPTYMAPEQADGRQVDTRSDLFSLGVILYRMATGVNPFAADSLLGVMSALANRTPETPSHLRPELPPGFDELVMGLLEKCPHRRTPHTADALHHTLAELESGRFVPTPAPQHQRTGRSIGLAIGGMVGGLALLLILLWQMLPNPAPTPPQEPTPEMRFRQFVDRLGEQPVIAFRTSEDQNGVFKRTRLHEHRFEGTTGTPIATELQDGRAEVKVPYTGNYNRQIWEQLLPKGLQFPIEEAKTVSGVIVVAVTLGADGLEVTDYAQTELGGAVVDPNHNAQLTACQAVLTLVREATVSPQFPPGPAQPAVSSPAGGK